MTETAQTQREDADQSDAEGAGQGPLRALAASVYGTITTLVAISGLTISHAVEQTVTPAEAIGVILVGGIAIALAHAMSHLVAGAATRRAPLQLGDLVAELSLSWPIVSAALPATAVMALTAAGLWSMDTGLSVALGVSIATLTLVGISTARLAETGTARRLVYVVAITAVGLTIATLEVVARHL